MSDKNKETEKPEQQDIEELVEKASEKLHVEIDWLRSITAEDIIYLLDHCPFLQIRDPNAELENQELKLIAADSGWTIHDYGDAMSSSPGAFLYGGGYFRISTSGEEDDEGGSGIVNPGKGTIRKQAFDTAMQMVEMAKANGWSMIEIVDGHPLMERAAWIKAEKSAITLTGFEPQEEDYKVRDLLDLSESDIEVLRKGLRSKK